MRNFWILVMIALIPILAVGIGELLGVWNAIDCIAPPTIGCEE